MKYLITLFLLGLLITASSAQKYNSIPCRNYLFDLEYDLAVECFRKCLNSTNSRCGKNFESKNYYAGILYFRIFKDDNVSVNSLDTNAIEKSILYFYTSLLYNIKGANCHKLDYKINNEKSIIINLLKNPEIEYWINEHKSQIFDYYLAEFENYIKHHKISEESTEILEILRIVKE